MTSGISGSKRKINIDEQDINLQSSKKGKTICQFSYPPTGLALNSTSLNNIRTKILENTHSDEDIIAFRNSFDKRGCVVFNVLKNQALGDTVPQSNCALGALLNILRTKLSDKFFEGIYTNLKVSSNKNLLDREFLQNVHDVAQSYAKSKEKQYDTALLVYALFFAINDKFSYGKLGLYDEEKKDLYFHCAEIYLQKGIDLEIKGDINGAFECFLRAIELGKGRADLIKILKEKGVFRRCEEMPIRSLDIGLMRYILDPSEENRGVLSTIQEAVEKQRINFFEESIKNQEDKPVHIPHELLFHIVNYLEYPDICKLQTTDKNIRKWIDEQFVGSVNFKKEKSMLWSLKNNIFSNTDEIYINLENRFKSNITQIDVLGDGCICLQSMFTNAFNHEHHLAYVYFKEKNSECRKEAEIALNSYENRVMINFFKNPESSTYMMTTHPLLNNEITGSRKKYDYLSGEFFPDKSATLNVIKHSKSYKFYNDNKEGIYVEFNLFITNDDKTPLNERAIFAKKPRMTYYFKEKVDTLSFIYLSENYLFCKINRNKNGLFSRKTGEEISLPPELSSLQKASYVKIIDDFLYLEQCENDKVELIGYNIIRKEVHFRIEQAVEAGKFSLNITDIKECSGILFVMAEGALFAYEKSKQQSLYKIELQSRTKAEILYLSPTVIITGFRKFSKTHILHEKLKVFDTQTGKPLFPCEEDIGYGISFSPQRLLEFRDGRIIKRTLGN